MKRFSKGILRIWKKNPALQIFLFLTNWWMGTGRGAEMKERRMYTLQEQWFCKSHVAVFISVKLNTLCSKMTIFIF